MTNVTGAYNALSNRHKVINKTADAATAPVQNKPVSAFADQKATTEKRDMESYIQGLRKKALQKKAIEDRAAQIRALEEQLRRQSK